MKRVRPVTLFLCGGLVNYGLRSSKKPPEIEENKPQPDKNAK